MFQSQYTNKINPIDTYTDCICLNLLHSLNIKFDQIRIYSYVQHTTQPFETRCQINFSGKWEASSRTFKTVGQHRRWSLVKWAKKKNTPTFPCTGYLMGITVMPTELNNQGFIHWSNEQMTYWQGLWIGSGKMGVVWEWGSHCWRSMKFHLNMGYSWRTCQSSNMSHLTVPCQEAPKVVKSRSFGRNLYGHLIPEFCNIFLLGMVCPETLKTIVLGVSHHANPNGHSDVLCFQITTRRRWQASLSTWAPVTKRITYILNFYLGDDIYNLKLLWYLKDAYQPLGSQLSYQNPLCNRTR